MTAEPGYNEVLEWSQPPWVVGPRLRAWTQDIEQKVIVQMEKVAEMPFIYRHVALMPDCHLGQGASIGSVIATQGAIMPATVGVDIGCGMIAVRTNIKGADLSADERHAIRLTIEAEIPMGRGQGNESVYPDAEDYVTRLEDLAGGHLGRYSQVAGNWRTQVGSLGSGNHFVEICTDEEDRVYGFLHSGSRGIGNRLAGYHLKKAKKLNREYFIDLPDPNLAYLPVGTVEFSQYMDDVRWCQEYAWFSRLIMMGRVLRVLGMGLDGEAIEESAFHCHHNFVEWENHYGKNVLVTRKGAISAKDGEMGLIPGSMGTKSYIVQGLENRESFHSAPHGAGRRMSRTAAFKAFTLNDWDEQMQGVEARRATGLIDEIPGAYKDIDYVMESSKNLVEVVHELTPIISVKGV